MTTFFNGLDVLYHRAKFGADCTTCAGCRCENVVFVCFLIFFICLTLQVQRAVRLRVTYFEPVLFHGLWVDFNAVFIIFHEKNGHSDALKSVHFRR